MTLTSLGRIACGVLAIGAWPAIAEGQSTRLNPYAFGGWSLQDRDSTALNGVTFGAGVTLTDKLSVEGAYSWHGETETNWTFTYLLGGRNGNKLTTDRDAPLVGAIRYSQCVNTRLCVDWVGGGGVNLHKVSTTALTECFTHTLPMTCVELDPPDAEGERDHQEPIVMGGFDFRLGLGQHLWLVPGMRVGHIWRSDYLTDASHRGPAERDSEYFSFSVSLMYRTK